MDNKVILWGKDDFNMLGLIRALGSEDLDVLFLTYGGTDITVRSKYCKKFQECTSLQDGLNFLLGAYLQEKSKPIIVASGDDVITFIDKNKSKLEDYFHLPGTKVQGGIQKYIDKYTMTKLAENLGIVCPKSRFVKWNSDIENISYPAIIKPSHQQDGHYNEIGRAHV